MDSQTLTSIIKQLHTMETVNIPLKRKEKSFESFGGTFNEKQINVIKYFPLLIQHLI